jgi:putative endonuclease
MFYVYVIKSNSKGSTYIGQTEDINKRIEQHNQGVLGRYTKNKGPWELVYSEEYKTRSEAMQREKYLKTGVGREFIKKKLEEISA